MRTTLGTLRINEALPPDLQREDRLLDKKGIHALLQEVAAKHPEDYKEILQKLNDVGRETVYNTGTSLDLESLMGNEAKEQVIGQARKDVHGIINDATLPEEERNKQIIDKLLPLGTKLTDALYDEAKKENNPYYLQVVSGSRGKKSDYNSLRGADLLTSDHTGKILPVPILHSLAEGLDPVEHFASTFAQRKGAIGVKMATADAGFLSKQLVGATHRFVVNKEKAPQTRLPTGLAVDPSDKANIGAVLAKDVGDIKAGTLLTPAHLEQLKKHTDEILVHSPMTELSSDGGVSRDAAGKRDRIDVARIGDNIGIPAAQAIGERLSQSSLGSKHSAAMAKAKGGREGFEYLNRLIQGPEELPESGPLSEVDGKVTDVRAAPQGGHYITVDGHEHYAPSTVAPAVAKGDTVTAGDSLTDGIPHPADLLKHFGMGEARRRYMGLLQEALENSNINVHRRNLEPVVAGLMGWGKVHDPDGVGEYLPDDIASFNELAASHRPRADAKQMSPDASVGRYLEEPALHHLPGALVTKKVADHLKKHGIADVITHHEKPGFEPHFQRGVLSVHDDSDPFTQQSGFYSASAFNTSVARGKVTDPNSSSYVGALAKGADFGKDLATKGTYGGSSL